MPQKQSTEESAFKNWINPALITKMAESLKKAHTSFNTQKFLEVSKQLAPLELKGRVRLIREKLKDLLPQDYLKALRILQKSAGDGTLKGFDLWAYADFIENYGLEHPTESLAAMRELTKLFTGEFAVRPYIAKYPKQTLKQLLAWATDNDDRVRRWTSEGSRPRLPWGLRLHDLVKDPSPTLPILEKLKYDESLFVRKSVANHLNDITKDNPDVVLKLLKNWQASAPAKHEAKIEWIIRHALRSLIKAGDKKALALIGFGTEAKVKCTPVKFKQKIVRIGEHVEFEFSLKCTQSKGKPQALMVDYIVHHCKAGGKTSPKVFKLKVVTLPCGETVNITKRHSFKPVTTRVYYSGKHAIEIQVNGKVLSRGEFDLKV